MKIINRKFRILAMMALVLFRLLFFCAWVMFFFGGVSQAAPELKTRVKLVISGKYLLLPVRNGAPKVVVQLKDGTELLREFEIELAAAAEPHWWAACEVGAWRGKTLNLEVSDAPPVKMSRPLERLLRQSETAVESAGLYREAHRPQLHFTVRRGWNNDPNGLVYFHGQYHMFYQFNPYGIAWGNMHWGHAVSPDLLHWTELDPAIYPHGLKGGAFSGGAFVDFGNRLGYGRGTEDVLIASYSGIGRGECIATASGDALALTDIPGCPVLKHRGWDPNVMFDAPRGRYVMVVNDRDDVHFGYGFYESRDLKAWRRFDYFEGFQDCPDLFELPIAGEGGRRWVLHGIQKRRVNGKAIAVAGSSYMVGSFEGGVFKPETGILTGHLGPAFYAGQTFSDMPDGRGVMLGWLREGNWPGMTFSQGMTVPLELSLHRTPAGLRLAFLPARELERLRERTWEGKSMEATQANALLKHADKELLDLALEARLGAQGKLTMALRGEKITLDAGTGLLSCHNTTATLVATGGRVNLRVLVDRGALELFAQDGLVARAFAGVKVCTGKGAPRLKAEGGACLDSLRVSTLRSIWEKEDE